MDVEEVQIGNRRWRRMQANGIEVFTTETVSAIQAEQVINALREAQEQRPGISLVEIIEVDDVRAALIAVLERKSKRNRYQEKYEKNWRRGLPAKRLRNACSQHGQ